MGLWDPMSCHYSKWDAPPPGISSWTKLRLGWIDSSKVRVVRPGERTEVLLGPFEEGGSETLVIRVPLSETTYYLIENRQPIGFDRSLPGKGILILYADDTVAECRYGRSPVKLVNANPAITHLEGAAFDVGKQDTFIDRRHGIRIQVLANVGNAYRILIAPDRP